MTYDFSVTLDHKIRATKGATRNIFGSYFSRPPNPGVLPYIDYTGMRRWKGYGFQAIYSGIGSSNQKIGPE